MTNDQVVFAPFHTLNEFMLPEYREAVLRTVLIRMPELSGAGKSQLNRVIKKNIVIPGFRNSSLAPMPLKIKGAVKAFSKNPEFTAQFLSAWTELNPELAERVYEILKERGWEILPIEADRTRLPGFLIEWPEGESYDTLGQVFSEKWPDAADPVDDIRLMIVWLSGRLPYNATEEAEDGDA
ncbi:MAG: hypothetical protein IT308_08455 [Anaerolineaceae bacterium]|nr:hypothetical protein [Anaerolineaceae bacterium]